MVRNCQLEQPAEDTLVPPLWGKRGGICVFLIFSRGCTRRNVLFHVETCQHVEMTNQLTRPQTADFRSRHKINPRPIRYVSDTASEGGWQSREYHVHLSSRERAVIIEIFRALFSRHQRPSGFNQTPGRRPPHATGRRVNTR